MDEESDFPHAPDVVVGRGAGEDPHSEGTPTRGRAAELVARRAGSKEGRALSVDVMRSVLKVFVVKAEPNFAQPWQVRPQRNSTGSGFVTLDHAGDRCIITNAHVVLYASMIHVRRPGNAKKFFASIRCLSQACDLAVLTVKDPQFWQDLRPLEFASVPRLQDSVIAVGYPRGGDSISVTKGVVSRTDMKRYCSGAPRLLTVQIDAAINPGNSGGPAFEHSPQSRVVGVAFARLMESDNVGYIIPSMIVEHFLREFHRDMTFKGVCGLDFKWQNMENTYLRQFHKMERHHTGVLVYKCDPLSSAAHVIKPRDVVMEVDGLSVADDGTFEFRGHERIDFSHLVTLHSVGDQVDVRILRDGVEQYIKLTVGIPKLLVSYPFSMDTKPSYFIVGGMVFLPLSVPFLEHCYGPKWKSSTPATILSLLGDFRTYADEEVVVLFQVLSADLNAGYKAHTVRLECFNGVQVRNLAHLAELVDQCESQWLEFQVEQSVHLVLDRAKAVEEGPQILQVHAITFDRSEDLRERAHGLRKQTSRDANGSCDTDMVDSRGAK
mmetsp:Transcript_7139/g.26259  ORF Transcript_7139/g.26259 Transcript_7139/m.26259 type:complete len:550 (+) Transcript_7139:192-1841(+)